jgi:uncharacterized protein with HEPN domain
MYSAKNVAYLLMMLEAIEKIRLYIAEKLLAKNDQMVFNACQTLLVVIGEESKKINSGLRHEHQEVPWKLIAGMRNIIAHDCRSISLEITHDVIQNYLEPLKQTLIVMLSKVDYPKEKLLASPFYKHLSHLLSE